MQTRGHVRLRDGGRTVHYPLSENRRTYLKPAAKWAADVRFADGRRKRVRFSPNREAASVMRRSGETVGTTAVAIAPTDQISCEAIMARPATETPQTAVRSQGTPAT